jgi:diguanylate cyclase
MNLQRIANSIVTRVILIGVVIVLLGTALRFFVLSKVLRQDIETLVASQQLALASYVATDIDQKIVQRKELLQRLGQGLPPALLSRPEQLRTWLGDRHELLPLFTYGVFVAGLDGRVIADFPQRIERAGINYADRDDIRGALAGEFTIGRPVIGRVAKEPVLPMAVPLRDASGRVRAVLAGITTLGAPGFLDLLQGSRIGQTGSFLLISPRDRIFVAAADPAMVLKPTPPPGVNLLHDKAMAGYRGTGMTRNAQGVEEISAMVSVPSTGWFVVARLPTVEAFATVPHVQGFVLKYSSVVAVIFLMVAAGGLLYTFRPLFRAANHADRMTRGEIPLEPLPIERNDEVGHLTAAFNRLLAKLSDSQRELDHMAHHDVLTGLPNRLLLADRMKQALGRARRNGSRVVVLSLDLDGFKAVNDTLGHEAGDKVLYEVAERLSGTIRNSDTLARIGGDEFIILLPDIDDSGGAARIVADKCMETMKPAFSVHGEARRLGVSIGIAMGDRNSSVDSLLLAADEAMYRAKQSGRGRYVLAQAIGTATAPRVHEG